MMGMFVGYCIYIICIYIYDYHGDMYVYQRLIHYTRGDITGDHFYLRNQKKRGMSRLSNGESETTGGETPHGFTRPGKLLHNYGKIHNFSWENPLFLWPFSIATLNYQRVSLDRIWNVQRRPFPFELSIDVHRFPSSIYFRMTIFIYESPYI